MKIGDKVIITGPKDGNWDQLNEVETKEHNKLIGKRGTIENIAGTTFPYQLNVDGKTLTLYFGENEITKCNNNIWKGDKKYAHR